MSAGNRDNFGGSSRDSSGGGGMADFPTSGTPGLIDRKAGGSGQQGQVGGDPYAQAQQHLQKYRFSTEEMKAIRECNKESFYFRCLPIGTVLGCGAYYGVRYGYLKPSPRFGAGPKMFIASIVGYFLGKLSYQHVCAEKLMALPNSQLGEILRKKKGHLGFQETLSMEPGFATVAPVGAPAFSNSDLSQPQKYSDVGDTRPMMGFDNEGGSSAGGYDFNHSPSYDTTQQMLDDENLPPKRPQFVTTYDDLRRQNRIDYESRQHSRIHPPPPQPQTPTDQRGSSEGLGYYENKRSPILSDGQSKLKNKYGDVWDDKPGSY